MRRAAATASLAVVLLLGACSSAAPAQPAPSASTGASSPAAAPSSSPATATPTGTACTSVVVAAGDIVNDVKVADRTGTLAENQEPDKVLVLGDNQYPAGALADYRTKYDRTAWGRLRSLTKPVPGNHEYRTAGASGYFAYFGDPPPYYAYDAGCGWRGYALNSEIDFAEELSWLRRDLAAHPGAAVVASWHRPRWSSGAEHGSDAGMQPLVSALKGRSGIILNGHEHNYERFRPVNGLRQFVAGTGGNSNYGFIAPVAGSEKRISRTPGVLRLDLQPKGAYRWAFLETGGTALDTGRSPG